MGRRAATLWHAMFSIAAGVLYFFFVLPRWPELTGETSHTVGIALRIVAGVVIALATLPVVFTLLRTRKPEYGTPQLALTLQTWSIVAHVLAGVLIVGTAISEIWLSLDAAGQWLFGIYGAAAAVAILGIFGFYLSFIAELPPPPPKPLKPKKETRRRLRRKRGEKTTADAENDSDEADAAQPEGAETEADAAQPEGAETEADAAPSEGAEIEATEAAETGDAGAKTAQQEPADVTAEASAPSQATDEAASAADALPTTEDDAADTAGVEAPRRGLRNRRPSGKTTGAHRRTRSSRGAGVEDLK